MQILSANELKTAGVSVRGHLRCVVVEAQEFQRLRDLELELALLETRADLSAGRCLEESVDAHLDRLDALAAELP